MFVNFPLEDNLSMLLQNANPNLNFFKNYSNLLVSYWILVVKGSGCRIEFEGFNLT